MKSISLPKLKAKTQALFNEFIRLRDSSCGHFICISCGEVKPVKYMHAGHFYSTKQYDGLRFNEDNAWGQCNYCNTFLYGNLIQYRDNLLMKLGAERFEALKQRAERYRREGYRWSRAELEEKQKEIRIKIKEYEKT